MDITDWTIDITGQWTLLDNGHYLTMNITGQWTLLDNGH